MIRAKQAKAPFAYFVQPDQLWTVAKHWFALVSVAVVPSQIPYQHEFTSFEVLTTTLIWITEKPWFALLSLNNTFLPILLRWCVFIDVAATSENVTWKCNFAFLRPFLVIPRRLAIIKLLGMKSNYIHQAAVSVEKNCARGFDTARSRSLKTEDTLFPHTDRHRLANKKRRKENFLGL